MHKSAFSSADFLKIRLKFVIHLDGNLTNESQETGIRILRTTSSICVYFGLNLKKSISNYNSKFYYTFTLVYLESFSTLMLHALIYVV